MDLEGLQSEISQMGKVKGSHSHVEYETQTNKINEQTKPNRNKNVETGNGEVVTKGKEARVGGGGRDGIDCMGMETRFVLGSTL